MALNAELPAFKSIYFKKGNCHPPENKCLFSNL